MVRRFAHCEQVPFSLDGTLGLFACNGTEAGHWIGSATKGGPMTKSKLPIIFVVDDDSVIATTLTIILQQNGFDAVAFTRPQAALESAQISCPDFVLSDVMMPEMLGTELAIELKKICSKLKILLFSGQAATTNLWAEANSGSSFEILSKPVHPTDLIAAIKRILRSGASE